MPATWIHVPCALCGGTAGEEVVPVPHKDAPDGLSRVIRCTGCGLRRLDPRPGPESIGGYYQSGWYNAYAGRTRGASKQRLWDLMRDAASRPRGASAASRLLRPVLGPLARWQFDMNVALDGREGLRVLEVGSGFGDILIYLKSRGCSVLGTDVSAEASEVGRRAGVEIRVGTLKELRLPDASFDVGLLCHSLEHVPDPNVELAELHRVLRPGGELQISVPNGDALRLELDGAQWAHLSHPLHFWFFDPASLQALLRRHGFEPLRVTSALKPHLVAGLREDARRLGLGPALARAARTAWLSCAHGLRADSLRVVAVRR